MLEVFSFLSVASGVYIASRGRPSAPPTPPPRQHNCPYCGAPDEGLTACS